MPRPLTAVRTTAAATVLSLALAGCAGSDPASTPEPDATASTPAPSETGSSATAEPSESNEPSEPEGAVVDVRITGDRVRPNGERVQVGPGEPLTLRVRSDRATELHVHSSPEQVLDIRPGRSTVELVVDRPGIVEVEEHSSGIVLFQLEVS